MVDSLSRGCVFFLLITFPMGPKIMDGFLKDLSSGHGLKQDVLPWVDDV